MSLWRRAWRPLAGALALFAVACLAIVADGLHDHIAPSDVGVILGSRVEADGRPSLSLERRLEEGLDLYRRGRFKEIIVSGGMGIEGYNEAKVMDAWLLAHGVPASAIRVDDKGPNTWATAKNTAAIMRAEHLTSALVVTQYFHVPRSRLALEKQGIRTVNWAHARFFYWRDIYSVPREVVGYGAYLIR